MPLEPRLIYLTGMPGSGKTTIGRALARLLAWDFKDSDTCIQEITGVTITTIFELEGEAGFRKRETNVLSTLSQGERCVIATGGGAILADTNRMIMSSSGCVVYLRAPRDLLHHRISRDKTRPMFHGDHLQQKLDALLVDRLPIYDSACHFAVDVGGSDPMKVAMEINRRLRIGKTHHPSQREMPNLDERQS